MEMPTSSGVFCVLRCAFTELRIAIAMMPSTQAPPTAAPTTAATMRGQGEVRLQVGKQPNEQ
jgi:hypothetical protein